MPRGLSAFRYILRIDGKIVFDSTNYVLTTRKAQELANANAIPPFPQIEVIPLPDPMSNPARRAKDLRAKKALEKICG